MRRLAACLLVTAVLAGCGLGPGKERGGSGARLDVTRGFGEVRLASASIGRVREDQTVMRFLRSKRRIATTYGGGFVQSIDGLAGNGAQQRDWFYCRYDQRAHGCQRTLGLTVAAPGGGVLQVTAKAYDDQGRAVPARGATVHAGGAVATTDAHGNATLTVAPGTYDAFADGAGAVRSQPVHARVG